MTASLNLGASGECVLPELLQQSILSEQNVLICDVPGRPPFDIIDSSLSRDGVENSHIASMQACFAVHHSQNYHSMYEAHVLSADNLAEAIDGYCCSPSHTRCNLLERPYSNGLYEYGGSIYDRRSWGLS